MSSTQNRNRRVALLEQGISGDSARKLATDILDKYFKTQDNYLVRHHIDSFDQFLQTDLIRIIQANNPILLLKDQIGKSSDYEYKMEIFVGGRDGTAVRIGVPTLSLQKGKDVRLLLPNEARLRNLTYQSSVYVDMEIKVTFGNGPQTREIDIKEPDIIKIENFELFKIPILLQSRYCVLHKKPASFLREAGECIYDQGGYFIVDGAEKVLVTKQQQAFNTLYIKQQKSDPKVEYFASISCLNPTSRLVKRVTFFYTRKEKVIRVGLPFVRHAVPLFVVFRAMGLSSDKEIVRTIFPDENAEDTKLLEPYLTPCIPDAFPFMDTYSAIQFIKTLTKGFSEAHVIDILRNQTFIHVENKADARIFYLAECVRNILRRVVNLDEDTSRDDTRNQRCLTSGFLVQQLFQHGYKQWQKATWLAIDRQFTNNGPIFRGPNFLNLFTPGNQVEILKSTILNDTIMRGFKGKWGTGLGEEKSGVLQALSRLSYIDFVSHCRRAVLEFDTSMKLVGPRRLHTSQYGYYCTNETPGGASIGITKNLSITTAISTNTDPTLFIEWLYTRGEVLPCNEVPQDNLPSSIPVYVNGGIVGFTKGTGLKEVPKLVYVLKLFKRTGCLPAYSSVGFNFRERKIFVYLDDGRPMRPLIHLGTGGTIPLEKLRAGKTWKELVLGSEVKRQIYTPGFVDPIPADKVSVSFDEYVKELEPLQGAIEYLDPYEQNDSYIANFPEHITPITSHLEIHPSVIVSMITGMIPFANHNQSVRNQLSDSQSKQGLSLYATNFQNRFDNTANILCYGEAPLVRTIYYDYLADGNMPYGNNITLALGCYTGYNQEDGILINKDALDRGLFRNINYRSYDAFEERDPKTKAITKIAHPKSVASWTDLNPGWNYNKLDDNGIVRVGELVDENTVIVGRYLQTESGITNDVSVTPQVWTRGRVESVVVTVNNMGMKLVKIRVTQDRIPELGDKFSNRHGQKGTIGMILRAQDMPRTAEGLVPDMIMNPHAIPSRMTIAQLLETLLGKVAGRNGAIGNGTIFMNEGDPSQTIGDMLQNMYGFEKYGNEYLYNGQTGTMIPSYVFIGPVYTMRLKHMVEDKWNARNEGRRERRTHQPTGGRGNQGGLRIGEMERDAIVAHGITSFIRETYMKRSDGTSIWVCNGCGTVPIYNEKTNLYICPLCDGPLNYSGQTITDLQILPPAKRSYSTFSKIEIPYTVQLLNEELNTYMNIGLRYITTKYGTTLRLPESVIVNRDEAMKRAKEPLPQRPMLQSNIAELLPPQGNQPEVTLDDLRSLGAVTEENKEAEEQREDAPTVPTAIVLPQGSSAPPGTVAITQGQLITSQPTLIATPLGQPMQQQVSRPGALPTIEEVSAEGIPESQEPTMVLGQTSEQPSQVFQPQIQAFQNPTQQGPIYMITPQTMGGIPVMTQQFGTIPQTPMASVMTTGLPGQVPGILQANAPGSFQTLLPAGYGAAPPTLVVETNPEAMASQGLPPLPQGRMRATTNSSQPLSQNRPRSPKSTTGATSGSTAPNQPVPPSVRVNIIKQGN